MRVLILAFLCAFTVASAEDRPNIILFIADDMSWDDCGAYGNPHVRTPNIDKLAKDGMRFTHAFLTISSCSPSRASIITGRYPHNTDADELHWPLPKEKVTFVEKLKAAGYWCGAAGKWHLGDAMRDRFDAVKEVDTSGFQLPTGKAGEAGKFIETTKGDAKSGCADWVPLLKERDKAKPFFLWLAALDPHRPYDDKISVPPHDPKTVRVAPYHPDTPKVREDYRVYYDEIARLDRFVGDVLAEVGKQGESENTVVLFISDNGRPFPRDKTTIYDSGIKTPWIVRWPAKVKAGSECSGLVSAVDIAPTFLKLAGVKNGGSNFEGKDFSGLLTDPSKKVQDFVFAEKNWHDYEDHARCARSERFKYIRNNYHDLPLTPPADAVRSPTYEEMLRLRKEEGKLNEAQLRCFLKPRPKEEFYDCVADPHELKNLAGDPAFAEELARHRKALETWAVRTGDKIPSMRTADEFDRETGTPTPARVRPRWSKKPMVEAGLTAP